jgi:galactonate dehydratase
VAQKYRQKWLTFKPALTDPINVPHHEGWAALKRSTRIPILTGEKLEMLRGFKPFIDAQSCDIIHPDLAFCGGFTGARKIADNYRPM